MKLMDKIIGWFEYWWEKIVFFFLGLVVIIGCIFLLVFIPMALYNMLFNPKFFESSSKQCQCVMVQPEVK